MQEEFYDVVVVGGGHAASEAALAAARMGAKTIMLTLNLDHIAQMSCNPCIGGIAKGHVVREIDAMGGGMGLAADASSIQFRMLNMTKGPAVWSPRSQCDKWVYQRIMKRMLERTENLTVRQALVCSFLVSADHRVCGVVTSVGDRFHAKAVVVATGTFLRGKMHYGLQHFPGGRAGDPPSMELSDALRNQLKLRMGRLKTGTPPRVLARSIDFSKMKPQSGDPFEEHFSFYPDDSIRPCVSNHNMNCYLTYSSRETAEIVRENLDKAPLYAGIIEGIGTRYCPSFEDKVVRFPQHERHLLYLEPEGEYTEEYYANGISTSLPPEIQTRLLHSVPGMEQVIITRYAYAIEYDFVFPEELDRTLGVRKWPGLYHAGQINGTSGYEEAAAQGLLAGLNAARCAAGLPGVEIGRDEAYLGVMVDDLVTKEIVEPYRLFTSRAEYRLTMRQDNADFRLSEKAWKWGLLPDCKYRKFKAYAERCESVEKCMKETVVSGGKTCWDLLKNAQGQVDCEHPCIPVELAGLDLSLLQDRRVFRQLAVRAHYEGYIRHEESSIAKLRALELWRIPEDFDYNRVPGLRNESRMKLERTRPSSLSQAGRIDGVTPAEIALLQVHLSRYQRELAWKREEKAHDVSPEEDASCARTSGRKEMDSLS